MKKLLIGLLVLGSVSAFADDCSANLTVAGRLGDKTTTQNHLLKYTNRLTESETPKFEIQVSRSVKGYNILIDGHREELCLDVTNLETNETTRVGCKTGDIVIQHGFEAQTQESKTERAIKELLSKIKCN